MRASIRAAAALRRNECGGGASWRPRVAFSSAVHCCAANTRARRRLWVARLILLLGGCGNILQSSALALSPKGTSFYGLRSLAAHPVHGAW